MGHPLRTTLLTRLSLLALATPIACSSATRADGADDESANALTASGAISSGYAGKCLDDSGAGTANGTKIQIWDCNGGVSQGWSYTASKTLRGPGGKCLDIVSDRQVAGTFVQLYACNGTSAQQWSLSGSEIKSTAGLCLDVKHAVNAEGTQVQVYTCNGGENQVWHVAIASPAPDAGVPGTDSGAPEVDAGSGGGETGSKLSVTASCATAVVVGLEWNAVAGATSYTVARNGATMGSTSTTTFADQTVDGGTSYTYTITATGSSGTLGTSSALALRTAAASSNGDPAYCPSTLVHSMTWNWASGTNQQDGSDLWPNTWGADGNIYAFFGDGGGFFGSDSNGRTSFGIAELTGSTPELTTSNAKNVYGGLNASHPSTITGKSGSILAVGADFYAISGIYQPGDTGGPSGSPNRSGISFSTGNAYSWKDNSAWTFCTDTSDPDGFCPGSFLNFGKGNEGARDAYVYVYGTTAQSFFGSGTPGPQHTYLARVPANDMLTKASYEVYAGVDSRGDPVWNADWTRMQPIFTDRGAKPLAIGQAVYNPTLKRYIATAQGNIGQAAFYESVNPWGPWSSIGYFNTSADGTGGWGEMGLARGVSGGDSLGINFINAWTSADGKTMWATFSSDGTAPSSTLMKGLAGKGFDSFNLVSVTLGD